MATLLLGAGGAALGGLFGPAGAIIGRAAGALAGYAIDQSLFGERRTVEGPRLADLEVQTSREGAVIPRAYGRVRIAGQMIWATRFEEVASETREGGKGGETGTTTRSYSYFANFAIGLCQGTIARIGRVWADGKPFDLSTVTRRVHRGSESQAPDSLIEAKQGEGAAPAYRGTAYIVFEHLALEKFGNRVPLFSFEVIRPAGGIEEKITAVTLIPGATEFGYDPNPVRKVVGPGNKPLLNRHVLGARTDWQDSLGELQALCPNLDSVGLVVSWFGDDLRANHCTLRPAVTDEELTTIPEPWRVAGVTRDAAQVVTRYLGKPAYGGTPSDATVIRAIRNLSARGLQVLFYPFIMMDIPAGNGLPDPYGGAEQGRYPWRGTITASIAPGEPGSPDKTATVASQVAAFVGTAAPDDFHLSGDTVVYTGPDEWSFRRLILHYAWLCKAAGGVDRFLIGSELRGLTTLRSSASAYPFVSALVGLATDVREVLGPSVELSYGADWSEYFGYQPADGSGDVFFHLDPLWASDDIDFVGIDNYMPLTDWRDGSDHLDAAVFESGRSAITMRANVAAGEGFDWYYASDADRATQTRTPISDGAYGKPWVYRYKDLAGWWSHQHFNRPGGIEAASPTAWAPEGKRIVFTEIGCPAVDKGANQPNVFPDPKSSASAYPYFSNRSRDDLVQRRFVDAVLSYWKPTDPAYVTGTNPVSSVYGGPMVDHAAIHLWTWDARPYPAFPYRTNVWAEGANWETGHWLTGRLGALAADDLVRKVLADYGITAVSVGELDGMIDGYLIDDLASARRALEPLAGLLMFEAVESGEVIRFQSRGRRSSLDLAPADLAEDSDKPLISIRRAQETELPAEIAVGFSDSLAEFRPSSASARRLVTGSRHTEASETGAAMSHAVASGLADSMLQDLWAGRETYAFSLTGKRLALEAGDVADLTLADGTRTMLVTRVEDGLGRRIEARSIDPAILSLEPAAPRVLDPDEEAEASAPEIVLLDLPLLTGTEPGYLPRIAAFAEPWPGAIVVAVGTPDGGYVTRQGLGRRATVGELIAPLAAGPVGRWDRGNAIHVKLYGESLAGLPEAAVLNGGNLAAVGTEEIGFEVVQFETATLADASTWRLEGLLRGQAGTSDVAAAGHDAGTRFVLIDPAVELLDLTETESWLSLTLRCGAAGAIYDPDVFSDVPLIRARRGLKCFAPVHLSAVRDPGTGDVAITWLRQSRVGGDAWEPAEIPLGEASEIYRVEIRDGADVVRTFTPAVPSVTYASADQLADFGELPATIFIRVQQVSPSEGPGVAAESEPHV